MLHIIATVEEILFYVTMCLIKEDLIKSSVAKPMFFFIFTHNFFSQNHKVVRDKKCILYSF